MRLNKTTLYLVIVFIIQWCIMIMLPYFFFKYIALYSIYPTNIYIDQFVKALAAFLLIGAWLLEWMWLGIFLYKYVRSS